MTTPPRRRPDEPGAVADDDQLLDALGRGEPAPTGDAAALLLAAWLDRLAAAGAVPASHDLAVDTALWSPAGGSTGSPSPGVIRAKRRLTALAGTALGALVLTGGAGMAAASQAEPGSPLWPITTLMFGGRAQARLAERDAERAIQDARTALSEGRYADVHQHLDRAAVLLDDVDPATHAELRAEIDSIRRALSGKARTGPSTPAPAPAPANPSPAAGREERPTGARRIRDADPSHLQSSATSVPHSEPDGSEYVLRHVDRWVDR